MKKPEWKDAPAWANHLWCQRGDFYAWSESKRNHTRGLWVQDKDTEYNYFKLWTKCWDYVEKRP